MSTVSGLSGFSSMFDPYLSAGQTRFTVSRFEGSFASMSGVTSGIGATDSSAPTSASSSSSSAASPVTITETYAPTVSNGDGGTSTPVTVTETSSPSVGSSQNQSDMLQALIAAQSRADQAGSAGSGDFDADDNLSASNTYAPEAQDGNNDPYAAGALSAYSAGSSDFTPSAGTGVSAWA